MDPFHSAGLACFSFSKCRSISARRSSANGHGRGANASSSRSTGAMVISVIAGRSIDVDKASCLDRAFGHDDGVAADRQPKPACRPRPRWPAGSGSAGPSRSPARWRSRGCRRSRAPRSCRQRPPRPSRSPDLRGMPSAGANMRAWNRWPGSRSRRRRRIDRAASPKAASNLRDRGGSGQCAARPADRHEGERDCRRTSAPDAIRRSRSPAATAPSAGRDGRGVAARARPRPAFAAPRSARCRARRRPTRARIAPARSAPPARSRGRRRRRRASASSTAVPTVGWPANGSSRAGVKMRSRARCAGSSGANTNTVSGWLNSRAIACIAAASSPSGSSTTASGLPAKRRSVNTSSVAKRLRIELLNHILDRPRRGRHGSDVTNSSCASTSSISREPCSAVRLSTPNSDEAASDSASAAEPVLR